MRKRKRKKSTKSAKSAGLPYKFDENKKKEILSCFANGYEKHTDIAQLTGLHRQTIGDWIRDGWITQDEIFQARNAAKLKAQKIVFDVFDKFDIDQVKGDTVVKTALWWLERKYPEEFAQKIEQRIKVEMAQKIVIQILEVIKHEIPDPAIRQRIADGLRKIYNI